MKTRFLIARLLLGLNLAALPAPLFAEGTIDPRAYSDAVMALSSTGVIDGGGSVRLDDYVNRAEALKIILKSQPRYTTEIDRTSSAMPPISLFPDIDQRQWYAPFVEVGFKYGLVKGYPDGHFWPNGGVRVAEAAAMLVRSYGEQNTSGRFLSSDDLRNEQGHWYTDALTILNQRGAVMRGSQLAPGDYLTRGELFNMVYRMQQSYASQPVAANYSSSTAVISVNGGQSSSAASAVSSSSMAVDASLSQYASKKNFAITIPSLGIVDLTITHPSDPFSQKGVLAPLQEGVGHLFSYPGQGGKVMIYGHSSGYPWDLSKFTKIFRGINEIKVGERVFVTYDGKLYVYQVTEKKTIPAKDKTGFEPDENGEQLVLYTCWPPDSITNRYLVYAKPVQAVAIK